MRKIFLFLIILSLGIVIPLCLTPAQSEMPPEVRQSIKLKDGSVIVGKLKNISNDTYTIETASFGDVAVSAKDVVNISSLEAKPPMLPQIFGGAAAGDGAAGNTPFSGLNLDQFQPQIQQMMNNPQLLSGVQEMLNDPQLREIFNNPQLMQDIFSMDPQRIRNNPSVQKLVNHPKFQELMRQMENFMPKLEVVPPAK